MRSDTPKITRDELRTPSSAAVAGIGFFALISVPMVLVQVWIPADAASDPDWSTDRSTELSFALGLIPFAAIAFLWFVGVIRDQLGELEDRLFSTVFLGSGLVFVALLLVWSGLIGATLATASADSGWAETSSFSFAASIVQGLGTTALLRMAAVFILSSATMFRRSGSMPRWIVLLSYGLGLALLVGADAFRELRLLFPVWVLVVSLALLRSNRSTDELAQGG